jgi:hypothetical protein
MELVKQHPDYVRMCNASGHGVGGIIAGGHSSCIPTIFHIEWPDTVKSQLKTVDNQKGTILKSYLETGGLLILWLEIEKVAPALKEKHITLLTGNSPSVS